MPPPLLLLSPHLAAARVVHSISACPLSSPPSSEPLCSPSHPRFTCTQVELKATRVVHLGATDPAEYPLAKKKQSFEFLREKAHLRPRWVGGGRGVGG